MVKIKVFIKTFQVYDFLFNIISQKKFIVSQFLLKLYANQQIKKGLPKMKHFSVAAPLQDLNLRPSRFQIGMLKPPELS